MTDFIVVLVTTPSKEEAERIAQALVEEHLAACVNIVSPVQSIYRWEGKVQNEIELLLVIKTRQAVFEDVSQRVRALHSYQNPEIVALPISAGSTSYFDWLRQATTQG